MRFDDMLATVFAQNADDSGAIAAAWMQAIDILAQDKGSLTPELRVESFARLTRLRPLVPVERRRAVAAALAGQPLPTDVVAYFGADAPVVAAPLLASARMSSEQWRKILPTLPQPARAILRERRDLPPSVRAMLSGFGSSDVALPSAIEVQSAPQPVEAQVQVQPPVAEPVIPPANTGPAIVSAQISDLVSRIEKYKLGKPEFLSVADDKGAEAPDAFRFETQADGIILWVDGAPAGAVIGINIGLMAEAGEHGVDGHAAGAFRKRTPFRDARMVVPGSGTMAGSWLISGTPWFAADDGRLQGYRCTARRPLREENLAVPAAVSVLGDDLAPDSVRQLVHELRTPLNAIRGFAEMIQTQILGPVLPPYRERAQSIIDDSRRLLSLFDDLDAAARLDQSAGFASTEDCSDARRVLHSVAASLSALTDARNVHLRIASGLDNAPVSADSAAVERMYARLLSTVLGLASSSETITAHLVQSLDKVSLSVARPQALKALSEDELYDPAYGPVGHWPDAPALGLAFALRLIANMARVAGGRLSITPDQFILRLPVQAQAAQDAQ